ncbi:MAG: hypothetical protein ACTSQX_16545 [Candidatus Heimdallarchaeota archaeon]
MKAIFYLNEGSNVLEQLNQIAQKYGTDVKLDDDNVNHFILAKPKLKIMKRLENGRYTIQIWGATPGDIEYLKSIWGEPARTEAQRLSPLEFAHELTSIPSVMTKTKEEIMDIMEIDDKQYTQYQKLIQNQLRRPNPAEHFVKAAEILKK